MSALFLMSVARLAAAPVFTHDIAPIVHQYCAPCHRPGEAGPFSLLTYHDVKAHALQIVDVTRRRYMPPWLPEPGHGDFKDELRLTSDQIQTIADWVAAGSPEGSVSDPPQITEGANVKNGQVDEAPRQVDNGWQLGQPDLILEAPQAFSLPASGTDVYWNFIFTANIPSPRWVRAIEIRPGGKRLVHHANLYVDRAHSARQREIAPGAGFPGMDFVVERTVFEPNDGRFLYWKPGGLPYNEPDGFAWRLEPGSDLVLNAHMQPSGKPEQVRPAVGLYFTDKPGTRFPMLVQLEHDSALNIPPGDRDFLVSDDFKLPMDVYLMAVYPHAHNLGHVLEAYATLPSPVAAASKSTAAASKPATPPSAHVTPAATVGKIAPGTRTSAPKPGGRREWLIRIPEWDRNWEAVYRYKEPVFLPKGTVISMRFHYDNSASNPRNPHNPPQRVHAGNRVRDEMAHLWLQVLPAGGQDRRLELQEAVIRHNLEKYPDDPVAHFHLGAVRLARLDAPGALTELETALRLDRENPEARNMLGSALSSLGRVSEAIEQFRLALEFRPDYENARFNLARALIRAGKFDEATDLFRKLVAVYPDDAQSHNALGELLFRQGKHAEALAEFDRAVALDPSFEVAKKNRELAVGAAK
jgi:predicted negative regulator of RcsB-dependent stress response